MIQVRSGFPDLLTPAFDMIFHQRLKELPNQYAQYFNVLDGPKKQNVQHSSVTGIDPVTKTAEGVGTTFGSPVQGFDKTYTFETRRGGYRVTAEMIEDDIHGISGARMAKALARSERNVEENDAANVFNNGFTTAGPDGQPLFSLSHPNELTGALQANTPVTQVDLSASSLEAAQINLMKTLDDTGFPTGLRGTKLVVHPNNFYNARRINESLKDPGSANNAINPIASDNLEIIVSNFVTDVDAFFVLTEEHQLNFFWRLRPTFSSDNDFSTDDGMWKVRSRYDVGYSGYRGTYASSGS